MEALRSDPRLISRLPTQGDILDFLEELKEAGLKRNESIHELSAELIKTWDKADCPPVSLKNVKQKMNDFLVSIKEAKRVPRESHQAKKPKTGIATRKSARQSGTEIYPEHDESSMCGKNPEQDELSSSVDMQTSSSSKSGPSPRPPSRTRSSLKSDPANDYKQQFSEKLFDILSHQKVKSILFDEDFYNDQKGPRTLWISKKKKQ